LFGEAFGFPDGKARLHAVRNRPSAELPDSEYPIYFTTGRYKEHYNSGAQTRRVPALKDARPIPILEVHPYLGDRLALRDGGFAVVESRRGIITFQVKITATIRPDTVFAPFHWGGRDAANALTIAALDPTSRMPEFKVCAVRVKAEGQAQAMGSTP
jgi:assimilatory nitrate reductase catalytic subunit